MARAEPRIAGVILAGGRSSRMGRDKAFVELEGVPLAIRARDRLAPQVARLAISANGAPESYAALGLPVLADTLPGLPGPLAGVLAALRWASATMPDATHVVSAAVDTPFVPRDLVARLSAQLGDGIAVAASAGRIHPSAALWPIALADDVEHYLKADPKRSMMGFLDRHAWRAVEFEADRIDPFLNINGPAELEAASEILRRADLSHL